MEIFIVVLVYKKWRYNCFLLWYVPYCIICEVTSDWSFLCHTNLPCLFHLILLFLCIQLIYEAREGTGFYFYLVLMAIFFKQMYKLWKFERWLIKKLIFIISVSYRIPVIFFISNFEVNYWNKFMCWFQTKLWLEKMHILNAAFFLICSGKTYLSWLII